MALLSRTLDPIFALTIGTTATWLRIRREETSRFYAAHPELPAPPRRSVLALLPFRLPLPGLDTPGDADSAPSPAAGARAMPPTNHDTWDVLVRRVREVDPRTWNWRRVVARDPDAKRWGIEEGPGR